jgi:histidinol-phosphatase (PHP family)
MNQRNWIDSKGSADMLDGHIHIEQRAYTLEWINQFVNKAVEKQLHEIWLLEHCYRFEEFVPMYDSVRAYSNYIDTWFHKKAGTLKLDNYLSLIKQIRDIQFPVKIREGIM